MSSDFVTARDQLANAFTITVHKIILARFKRAIRQRQVVLNQFGVPLEIISLLSIVGGETTSDIISTEEYETLAYCFYHFINYKFWEADRGTEQWTVEKADFEDGCRKQVRCFTSKVAICQNSIVLRATVGYKVLHTAIWVCPPGSVEGLIGPAAVGGAPSKRKVILSLTDALVSTGDATLRGSWYIKVTIGRRSTAKGQGEGGGATAFSTQQMADVAEFQVHIKPRHDLAPLIASILAKLPAGHHKARSSAQEDDEEEEDLCGGNVNPEDALFYSGALQYAPATAFSGALDPPPLPRPPKNYKLPPPTSTGPSIPLYVPYTVTPPRTVVVGDGVEAPTNFSITPLSFKTNQSLGGKVTHEGKENVPTYTQFVDITVQVLNKTDRLAVFQKAPVGQAVKRVTTDGIEVVEVVKSTRAARFDTRDGTITLAPRDSVKVMVRCEYEVIGRPSGQDNYERSLLDPFVFPQPVTFRLTIEEAHSSEIGTVEVEQYNPNPGLETRASFLSDALRIPDDEDLLLFVTADDTEFNRRFSAAVFLDRKEQRMVLARRNTSTYLSLLHLQEIAYRAMMSGDERTEIDGFADNEHYRAWLLTSGDAHPVMVYGIEVEVKTGTSVSTASCHVTFGSDVAGWLEGSSSAAAGGGGGSVSSPSSHSSKSSTVTAVRDAILNSGSTPFRPEIEVPPAATATDLPPATTTSIDSNSNNTGLVSDGSVAMGNRAVSTSMGYHIHYDSPMGQGAFGAVYRAFELETGRTVAVKETLMGGTQSAAARRGTATNASNNSTASSTGSIPDRKEFDVLVSLSHPNIVKVLNMDVSKEDGVFRVFMEWLPGGSVSSVIRQQQFRLHENVLRKYARDALRGLAHLHERGILHLDVKPGNMLVSHDGDVKLADFGTTVFLNKTMTSVTGQSMVGTPAYMAPEIISAGKYYRGSDIWAWACSVVEMGSGLPPWHDLPAEKRDNALPLMFHIGTARPPHHAPTLPAHLSQPLRDILYACFSPSLSLRPTATTLLETDYFARDTLPLDVEPMDEFYQASQERQRSSASAQGDGGAGSTGTTSSWVSTSSALQQDTVVLGG